MTDRGTHSPSSPSGGPAHSGCSYSSGRPWGSSRLGPLEKNWTKFAISNDDTGPRSRDRDLAARDRATTRPVVASGVDGAQASTVIVRIATSLAVAVAALAIAGGAAHKTVTVPNVIGMRGFVAGQTLERAGLRWQWGDGSAPESAERLLLEGPHLRPDVRRSAGRARNDDSSRAGLKQDPGHNRSSLSQRARRERERCKKRPRRLEPEVLVEEGALRGPVLVDRTALVLPLQRVVPLDEIVVRGDSVPRLAVVQVVETADRGQRDFD